MTEGEVIRESRRWLNHFAGSSFYTYDKGSVHCKVCSRDFPANGNGGFRVEHDPAEYCAEVINLINSCDTALAAHEVSA